MSELTRQIEDLRAAVRTDWAPERSDRVIASVAVRRRRRAVASVAGAAGAIAVIATAGFSGTVRLSHRPVTAPLAVAVPDRPEAVAFSLADGTRVEPTESGTWLRRKVVTANRVIIELSSGAAHFDVTPNPERRFVVESGAVNVTVLGTAFAVQRLPNQARVSVDRGRVRVSWMGGATEINAGGSGVFPPTPESSEEVALPEAQHDTPESTHIAVPAPSTPARGEPAIARWEKDVTDLLQAADDLRAAGRDAEAIGPFTAVVERHATDPRAPAAAFTVGRLYLEKLDRPLDAARAFARCRELDPTGPLAEDALARGIESLAKGGNKTAAAENARQYLRFYPQGSRADDVRAWGNVQ